MSLIETIDLEKHFIRGDELIKALDNVSLRINEGEFVSITGASGSGKSTLLYILGLIDKQTRGTYRFAKTVTDDFSDNERSRLRNQSMGFIFQSFHLLPRATAIRNVSMPLEYSRSHGIKVSKQEVLEKAERALERVGLKERMHHLPNELSGGQCQRVAIARALISNPQVIFADEPTGNLDSRNAREIIDLFKSLNNEGRTILLVTHDQELASMTKRSVKLKDGRIEEEHSAN